MEGTAAVDDSRISPDGKWVLASISQQLHVLEAPSADKTIDFPSPAWRIDVSPTSA